MPPKLNEEKIINIANYLIEWKLITECERAKIIYKARNKIAYLDARNSTKESKE